MWHNEEVTLLTVHFNITRSNTEELWHSNGNHKMIIILACKILRIIFYSEE